MSAIFDRYGPQMIADLVKDFKLLPFQAAGFPGNAGGESAGFTDIIEDGAIAKGWAGGTGWFQWTASRRKEFEAWLRRKGWKADSYEGNYSFLYRELIGPEKRSLAAVRKAKTLEEATELVWALFERPEDSQPKSKNYRKSLPTRIRWAKRALDGYNKLQPKPTVWAKEESDEMAAIAAILANPVFMQAVMTAVTTAVTKLGKAPDVQLPPSEVPVVANAVIKEIQKVPEIQHATNTEPHWYQQRSKWSAIIGTATAIVVPLLATFGVNLNLTPDMAEHLAAALAAIGGLWAAYLALRAGIATKPLQWGSGGINNDELILEQMRAMQEELARLREESREP